MTGDKEWTHKLFLFWYCVPLEMLSEVGPQQGKMEGEKRWTEATKHNWIFALPSVHLLATFFPLQLLFSVYFKFYCKSLHSKIGGKLNHMEPFQSLSNGYFLDFNTVYQIRGGGPLAVWYGNWRVQICPSSPERNTSVAEQLISRRYIVVPVNWT